MAFQSLRFRNGSATARSFPFGPEDINLVQGQPRERRSFLDIVMCQIDREYLRELISYKRCLAERNALLSLHLDDMQL